MAYYDALVAKWATLPQDNTREQNLSLVNAATVDGPKVDVSVGAVIGFLALQGVLANLRSFVASPPNGSSSDAIIAATELMTLISTPQITMFRMSDPTVYGAIQSFLTALVGASLLSAGQEAILLAMAATTKPWWEANGYSSPFNEHDLINAGIYAVADAIADGILEGE